MIRSGQQAITARLRLGAQEAVLGVPASAIAGRIVALEDLWGNAATRRLFDRLADARDMVAAAAILDSAIAERLGRSARRFWPGSDGCSWAKPSACPNSCAAIFLMQLSRALPMQLPKG